MMDKKVKYTLIAVAIFILILVGVGVFYYLKGKKQTTIAPPVDDVANIGTNSQVYSGQGATVTNSEVASMAESLHTDMKGLTVNRDNELLKTVLTYSNNDLSRLYSAFNVKFQKESRETFTQWLENERAFGEWSTLRDAIVNRLQKLKLV